MNHKLTAKTLFAHPLSLVFPMPVNTCVEAQNQNAQDSEHEQKKWPNIPFHLFKARFFNKCMLCISVKRKINEQPLPNGNDKNYTQCWTSWEPNQKRTHEKNLNLKPLKFNFFVSVWVPNLCSNISCYKYRGSPPYAFFGTWKKLCYMKLVLVGLYCGPLLTLIPPLTRT